MSIYNKEIYAQLKEQGLCVGCRKPISKGSRCFECNEKARIINAKNKPYQALRERRKSQGLCVNCGKPSLTNNCEDCKAKRREYERKRREFSKSLGICPRCNKNKLIGDEKNCLECRIVQETSKEKWESNNREKVLERRKIYSKTYYEKSKQENKCVCCGTKLKKAGIYCFTCAERKNNAKRHEIPRSERIGLGLCYLCGEPMAEGSRMCKKHLEQYRLVAINNNKQLKANHKGWFKYDVLPRNVDNG